MKHIITDINKFNKSFSCMIQGKKERFILTKKQVKTFMKALKKGIIVEFSVLPVRKVVNRKYYYQIANFEKILVPSRNKTLKCVYSFNRLKNDMKKVLEKYNYYLIIDFEMSMGNFHQKNYIPEIIQAGYVLTDKNRKVIKKDGYYVKPTMYQEINRRTIKFLDINIDEYNNTAVSYQTFYSDLKQIIKEYNPQFITWGKNDLLVLNQSYSLNNVLPLADEKRFTNLLQLHKNYYNLKNDLGLFKAYKTYYQTEFIQVHDAVEDAMVTRDVFDAFIKEMQKEE